MNPGIPKIDMDQCRIAPDQDSANRVIFTAINQRRLSHDILEITSPQPISLRRNQRFHIIERETIRILPVLRNDKGLKRLESG